MLISGIRSTNGLHPGIVSGETAMGMNVIVNDLRSALKDCADAVQAKSLARWENQPKLDDSFRERCCDPLYRRTEIGNSRVSGLTAYRDVSVSAARKE